MSFKLIIIIGDSLLIFFNRFQVIHENYNMDSKQVVSVVIDKFFEENSYMIQCNIMGAFIVQVSQNRLCRSELWE